MQAFNPKKSIVSRYSKTKVNSKYYAGIDFTYSGNTSDDIGVVYMPYVFVNTGTIVDGGFSFDETTEEKAERVREERKKKIDRIFKEL